MVRTDKKTLSDSLEFEERLPEKKKPLLENAVKLYLEGNSLIESARNSKCDSANLWRILKRRGLLRVRVYLSESDIGYLTDLLAQKDHLEARSVENRLKRRNEKE